MKIKHAEEYSIRQVIEIFKDSKATELALKSSFEKEMAGKQNLPSSSDALRELGYHLVQYILFSC